MTGSDDETKNIVNTFIAENNKKNCIEIKYYYQENQGKMSAINNLIQHVKGDLIIECDSDDYLRNNAIKIIASEYESIKDKENIYAIVFLKYNENECNIGNTFKSDNYESTMFDLYFKDGLTGDKALVYISNIRKQYKYILEKNERFSTEALMQNKMDKKYKVICFNKPIMICKYLNEGYSLNNKKLFLENPYSYFEYFKQLLNFNMNGVLFSKRLYAIKHYILFCYLTKQRNILKNISGNLNKLLTIILYVPGIIKSYIYTKKETKV